MRLTDIISKDAIVPKITSKQRDEVIATLIDAAVATGGADPSLRDELLARVLDRERLGSTGFGCGVAVPHVKHQGVKKMTAAVGLAPQGVDFNALDKQPVYSVFLLMSPKDKPEDHLQAMEVIFKNLSNETFRRFLRQAQTAEEAWALFEQADSGRS